MSSVVKMRTAICQCADTGVIYKTIANSPDHQIGSDGSVWTKSRFGPQNQMIQRGRWRRMSPHTDRDGYQLVTFAKQQPTAVHRLVLEAFVGPCPAGKQCRHKDGNPGNNHLTNLAWSTPKRNNQDKKKHGTAQRGAENNNVTLTAQQVLQIRLRKGGPRGTVKRTAEEFGIHRDTVRHIWTGKTWSWL